MLNPYGMIGRAMALFKAAGLAVPAYGEAEKRRLLDAWVQRYGRLDDEIFMACAEQLAPGQRFPRFFDMDEAVRTELRARKQAAEHAEKSVPGQPVDHETNKKRLQNLIKILSRRI